MEDTLHHAPSDCNLAGRPDLDNVPSLW
jgi:hypothetical protein